MRRDMRNAWQFPLATHPRFVYSLFLSSGQRMFKRDEKGVVMMDSEKVARLEKDVSEQDRRLDDTQKSVVAVETKTEQNEKNINRVESQSITRFEQLLNRIDAGFDRVESNINRVESNLKSDINRVEPELKTDRRWFYGLIATTIISVLVAILSWYSKYLDAVIPK